MTNIRTLPLSAEQMVDLDQYPIAEPGSKDWADIVDICGRQYRDTGLCMLPGFVRPWVQEILAAEANAVCAEAYFCKDSHNAYLTDDDPDWLDDDVRHKRQQTFVGSVAYDFLPVDSHIKRLYLWDPLKQFIGAVLGKSQFHRFADSLGACSINVFVDGGEHGWHFDESEFTITLMLQPPESGGVFEFVPLVRDLPNEAEIVTRVLDGDRDLVRELPFVTGTLLIFGGRQTIHRVTPVSGARPRLVPVLCYSEEPEEHNSEAVRKLFWGRTGNEARSR